MVQKPTKTPTKASVIRELQAVRDRIAKLEMQLHVARLSRDELALELVQEHKLTWRETAALGGFANPYIARILREARKRES